MTDAIQRLDVIGLQVIYSERKKKPPRGEIGPLKVALSSDVGAQGSTRMVDVVVQGTGVSTWYIMASLMTTSTFFLGPPPLLWSPMRLSLLFVSEDRACNELCFQVSLDTPHLTTHSCWHSRADKPSIFRIV